MVAFNNQKIGPKEQFAANHFQGIILDMIISFCFPIVSKLFMASSMRLSFALYDPATIT